MVFVGEDEESQPLITSRRDESSESSPNFPVETYYRRLDYDSDDEEDSFFETHAQDMKTPGRTRSIIVVAFLMLLGSIEYGLILPTVWDYLNSLGEDRVIYIGIILSVFCLSKMIFSPLIGHLSDSFSTKKILAFTVILNIIGNLVYFSAQYSWMIVLSRVITGIGASSDSVISSFVIRVTSDSERTPTLTKLYAFMEFGLLIGPGLNFILRSCDFYIFGLPVNKLTAPGLFVACLSFIGLLLLLVFFQNPPPSVSVYGSFASGENSALFEEKKTIKSFCKKHYLEISATIKSLCTLPIATIFVAQFVLIFNQMTMETILTPMTKVFYDWGTDKNSLMYILIAVLFMVVYGVLNFLSSRIEERYLIAVGLLFECTALGLGVLIFGINGRHYHLPLYQFCLEIFFFATGLPFLMVAIPALYSKLTIGRNPGLSQGLLQITGNLGSILGPLWGSSIFGVGFTVLFGVMFIPLIMLIILYILSFKRFRTSVYFEVNN